MIPDCAAAVIQARRRAIEHKLQQVRPRRGETGQLNGLRPSLTASLAAVTVAAALPAVTVAGNGGHDVYHRPELAPAGPATAIRTHRPDDRRRTTQTIAAQIVVNAGKHAVMADLHTVTGTGHQLSQQPVFGRERSSLEYSSRNVIGIREIGHLPCHPLLCLGSGARRHQPDRTLPPDGMSMSATMAA